MLTKSYINLKRMAEIRLRSKVLYLGLLGGLLTSCVSSQEHEVELALHAYDDLKYYDAYTKNTSNYEVIKNFETKFRIHATLLSGEFRQAIASRYQKIYAETQPILGEATDKTGFFVSLYVADDEQDDLRDHRLWNIFLETESGKFSPILIKKLGKKARWKTFFPAVDLWTHEYLVLFDLPNRQSNKQQLVKETSTKLVVANGAGKVLMEW